jgi:ATP-dependent helicase/DNAse subunit B
MARVSVLCGPYRSSRVQRIDDLVRGQWGHSLLVVPTPQRVQSRREKLLLEGGLKGGWGDSVTTFRRFALNLLQSAQVPVRELSEVERRLLLEQVVARMRRGRDDPPPALASRGFVSHLQHVITLLKQAAIDPAFFKERVFGRRHPSWLDAIVAEAYEEYQDALQARQAYDVVGLYWQAALACAREAPPLLRDVSLMALDGFDDFTPSEFRLLQALAPHVDALVFGIACNRQQPSQGDVYRIPIQTASLLQQAFDADQEDLEEAPPATHAQFAASQIFSRDIPPSPDGLTPNIQLLPCATVGIEAQIIARRVKALILEGEVPAGSIAVVHRDLQTAAPRLLAALAEAGVPVQIERKQRLSESAFGHFLLLLLDAWEGWERPALEEVLASPFFAPHAEHDAYRDVARTVLRLACGARGYEAVHGGLTAFIGRLQRSETIERMGGLRSHPEPIAAAQAVLHAVEFLREQERALRRCATSGPFAHAVQALCEQLAPENAVERLPAESMRNAEASACKALRETLARYAAWYDSAGETGKRTWPELTAELRQVLAEASFTPPSANTGVRVLDADAVRHINAEAIFLAGMNAGVFPRPARANAIYSEANLRDLQENHIPLETKQKQVDRELLLFQQVLSSARRRLWISWAYESGSGRELLRSPFVGDLEDLFGKGTLDESNEGRRAVPDPQEVAGWRDVRAAAAATEAPLPQVLCEQLAGVFDRIELERARQGFAPFGVYDGILVDDALVEQLRERFGDDHVYSADQLETYAECPFAFFAQRVLDVQETDVAGPEIDARVRGSIFHDVLQRLYETYRGRLPASIALEEAETRIVALLDEAFERLRRSGMSSDGLLAAEHARAAKILARHLRLHLHDGDWVPSYFEVSFGRVKERSEDPCNRADPVLLATDNGPIRLAGKIDRIDIHDGCVRIIDYKTSVRVGHRDIEDGVSVQLLLYALAVEEHLLPGRECAQAVLLEIGGEDSRECLNRDGKARGNRLNWREREQMLRRRVSEYVTGIQGGHFPPRPYQGKPCEYCAMRRACRYEKARVERKEGAAREVD